ncbi:hypothetical protein [Actinokineospora enzanensis]|uniref:hypothetical protein n=1 Tax=Actinokineospora enzanensis TaxID=155975 RepID=UPI0012EBCFC7|nr:hypothetical protein [Actinokineospora enzanensis]
MTSPDDLDARFNDFGGRISIVERDLTVTRQAAEKADTNARQANINAKRSNDRVKRLRVELREFRTTNNMMINTLREDMIDGFARIDARFAAVDARFAAVDARLDENFTKIDQNFATIEQNFAAVDRSFTAIRGVLDATAAGQAEITRLIGHLIAQSENN